MITNLAIDDHLIEEAKRIGGHKTKKAVVTDGEIQKGYPGSGVPKIA